MLRHALFASAVMLAGTFGFAGVASADSATVTFNGSIDSVCSFDNSTASSGSLVPTDYYSAGLKDSLVAYPNGQGTPAQINVTCNAPGSLSVGEPIPSASNPASTYAYASVFDQYGEWLGSQWSSAYINAGSAMPLQIGMQAYNQNYGQALPAGNYQYTVTLTAVGN